MEIIREDKESIRVEMVRDEIVLAKPQISFVVPRKADPTELGRRAGVSGVDGRVQPTRARNTFRWSPNKEMAPGRYKFVVEPLVDSKHRRISAAVEIPFTVVATKARITSRVRIESFSRIRFGDSGPERLDIEAVGSGKFTEFVKAADRRTGKPVELAFDQEGKAVNGERIVRDYEQALAKKQGRIHPALDAAIRAAKAGQSILVDVWLDITEPEPSQADRPLNECDQQVFEQRSKELRQEHYEAGRRFAEALPGEAKVVAVDELAPLVTVKVPAPMVKKLAGLNNVGALLLCEEDGIEDLEDSIAIARSSTVHAAGETGSGVRVAVWENGPTSNADLVIAGRYKTNPATSDHSQNVHAIIRNKEEDTPDGHAPGCSLYSANDKKRAALTWAVKDQECTVINQSFHRSSEPGSDTLSSDDLYGDWLALHWPYPLIVHAAGNFWNGDPDNINPPSSEYVNHKGYNTISVGNHNDDASAMATSSVFRNPQTSHADRELPEIAANGVSVTADDITMTGTSQASPAVAGVAALLQGTAATLKHWPEGCRAILLAGATRNVRDDTWWRDVVAGTDARDGAGSANAAESRQIALNRRWRGAPASRRGWDIGLLSSADFGGDKLSTFEYRVQVPGFWWGPRHVKVALAWTSKVSSFLGLIFGSQLTVDLDLKVFDENGTQVGYSGSWDNSYEIAEFTGSPGKTYTIRIRRWSGTDSTWFGIAWTVTGGLLLELPLELTAALVSRRGLDST
jgi:hypothetical protein